MAKKKFNMDEFIGKTVVKAIKAKKVKVDVSSLVEVPETFLHRLDETMLKRTNEAKRAGGLRSAQVAEARKEDEEALLANSDNIGWIGGYVDKDLVDGVVVVIDDDTVVKAEGR